MILALDIETIPNPEMVPLLPEPECTDSRLKDPDKIEAHIQAKRDKQHADMALDPLTGRVCCFALVGRKDDAAPEDAPTEFTMVLPKMKDKEEKYLIQTIFDTLGKETTRIATWNGIGFDLPFIYKRAMILGVNPANFGAPPLTAWTKRYNTDRHFDLMKIWDGWQGGAFTKLDTVAGLMLGANKDEIDFAEFPALIETAEGREKIGAYCLQDTRLTWRLWERFNGTLFA